MNGVADFGDIGVDIAFEGNGDNAFVFDGFATALFGGRFGTVGGIE